MQGRKDLHRFPVIFHIEEDAANISKSFSRHRGRL